MGRADGGAVKLGSLFSGAGGLDLAVEAVFGATERDAKYQRELAEWFEWNAWWVTP